MGIENVIRSIACRAKSWPIKAICTPSLDHSDRLC